MVKHKSEINTHTHTPPLSQYSAGNKMNIHKAETEGREVRDCDKEQRARVSVQGYSRLKDQKEKPRRCSDPHPTDKYAK